MSQSGVVYEKHFMVRDILKHFNIIGKGVPTPLFQNHPTHYSIPPLFLQIAHPPHLTGESVIPSFLNNRNATLKFSSISTIHIK